MSPIITIAAASLQSDRCLYTMDLALILAELLSDEGS
jgi:hypothetical protein